jgi:hypothetical protein
MRVVEWVESDTDDASDDRAHWAAQTRRVLTRDLLRRALAAPPAESHALQFRALHLNLPLVRDVADRLSVNDGRRATVEHHALNALVDAVRTFDAFGTLEFDDYATPLLERQIATHLPRPGLRLMQPGPPECREGGPRPPGYGLRRLAHRVALVIAGFRA